ncbi:MAG: hypothetical protein O3C40_33915 [Planctomycetota bacterium]|nr:hypothetical protein [Planctomycetota bacterium]
MHALILFSVMVAGQSPRDDVNLPEQAARIAEALQLTTDAATGYEFEVSDGPPRKLAFHSASILRWSNPAAGELYGNVFVWTHEGRPEVIGSLYQWYSPHTHGAHEFHSLATTSLSGARDEKVVWKSDQPGVQLRRLPEQQAVADTPPARLRQMREAARQFTIVKTDREEVSQEMRLLPQPVYRYPKDGSLVLDGGVFMFVQGTDPEVVLLVEARENGERWEWQYALARMNSVRLVAKYRNREVWRVERLPWGRVTNHLEPYTSFGNIQRPQATD